MERKKICLDSSFVFDLLEGDPSSKEILEKYKDSDLFITEMVLFEVTHSIFTGKKGNNKKRFDKFMDFVGTIQIVPTLGNFAMEAAKISAELIKKGKRIEDADCLIAGMMLSWGMTKIITKNTKHFSRIKGIEAISY